MPHFKPAHVSRNRHARIIGAVERKSSFEKQNNAGQVSGKFIERDLIIDGDDFREGKMGRPYLSKAVLLYEPAPIVDKKTIMPRSCAVDLASRLGLLPGQADELPLEYDDYVPIDHIVCRDNCCCGQISRYGLIFLVSRHHQEITIGQKLPEAVTPIIMETTLGRFTYYTREDRNFVHFDTNICLSNTPLILNQKMDDILLSARGYYLINDSAQNKNFVWRRCYDPLEFLVSRNFFGLPDAVIYMPSVILKKWKQLERFSRALHDAVTSVLGDLREPDSFTIALKNLPQDDRSSIKDCIQMETTAERLAACVYICRALSRRNLIEMDFDSFHMFARIAKGDLTEAHQHFRSQAATYPRLFQTSQDRFMRLFLRYKPNENAGRAFTDTLLRRGLLGLLHSNRNNVSLVVFQGFLAIVSLWNCCRVLSRAREAPEEWIKFVVADDDDIYMD